MWIDVVLRAQGSQYENVHVHMGRFKGKRNLPYTACTRAKKRLKISGLKLDDEGDALREVMELHPKSVLWQAELQIGDFSEARVAAARLEVEKRRRRMLRR